MRTVLAILVFILLCDMVMPAILSSEGVEAVPGVWHVIGAFFTWLSYSSNWLIIGVLNRGFRQAYRARLLSLYRRLTC